MNRISVLRFVSLGAIWGSSYTFIKVAIGGMTAVQLVLARVVLGAAVLLAFCVLRRVALPRPGVIWLHLAVTATLGMVAPFLLLGWGEHRTSAAMAGVLIAALPLFTMAAVAFLLPAEKLTRHKVYGLCIGFVGVILAFSPWQTPSGSLPGQLAVLGAALCYALQAVYIRRIVNQRSIAPLALAASQLVAATVLQAVVALASPEPKLSLTWSVTAAALVLGIAGTGIAYVLFFRLIADLGATTASTVNYLVPVAALLISTLGLGESVTWSMPLGVAVVLLGLAVAENRLVAPRPAAEPRVGPTPPRSVLADGRPGKEPSDA